MWLGEPEAPSFLGFRSKGEAHAFDAGSIDLPPQVVVPLTSMQNFHQTATRMKHHLSLRKQGLPGQYSEGIHMSHALSGYCFTREAKLTD